MNSCKPGGMISKCFISTLLVLFSQDFKRKKYIYISYLLIVASQFVLCHGVLFYVCKYILIMYEEDYIYFSCLINFTVPIL